MRGRFGCVLNILIDGPNNVALDVAALAGPASRPRWMLGGTCWRAPRSGSATRLDRLARSTRDLLELAELLRDAAQHGRALGHPRQGRDQRGGVRPCRHAPTAA
jgi:hypothetical protein